ncbi:hypothetical protein BH18ACI5_BH18ACI5_01640 [soil metagenome]
MTDIRMADEAIAVSNGRMVGVREVVIASWVTLVTLVGTGCRRQAPGIEGIPASQQQSFSRPALGRQWPFAASDGTLGCDKGAVLFRVHNTTYAVDASATANRFPSVDEITLFEGSGPPSNPLGRIKQDDRTQIFLQSSACETSANPAACKDDLRRRNSLSHEDLTQIEAEGRERRWPPLPRPKMSVQPVIDRGLKLCQVQ